MILLNIPGHEPPSYSEVGHSRLAQAFTFQALVDA
jgi:hypothetical protein